MASRQKNKVLHITKNFIVRIVIRKIDKNYLINTIKKKKLKAKVFKVKS